MLADGITDDTGVECVADPGQCHRAAEVLREVEQRQPVERRPAQAVEAPEISLRLLALQHRDHLLELDRLASHLRQVRDVPALVVVVRHERVDQVEAGLVDRGAVVEGVHQLVPGLHCPAARGSPGEGVEDLGGLVLVVEGTELLAVDQEAVLEPGAVDHALDGKAHGAQAKPQVRDTVGGVRILFSSTSGDGHLNPMLPLAHALRTAGHDVAFAMAAEFGPRLEGLGFSFFAAGPNLDELNRRTFLPQEDIADLEMDLKVFVGRFAFGDAPDRVDDLRRVFVAWRPQLVVTEPCDFAGPIIAAATSTPVVLHSFGRPLARAHYEAAGPFVEPLWHAAGLATPELGGVYGRWYVDICPARLRDEPVPAWTTALPLRPTPPPEIGTAPDWLLGLPERPTVYVTLGTIFNHLPRFRMVLESLGALDVNVIATVGRDNDPADLGAVPSNATVHRFVAQDLLLPRADAMVGHGGSGSMLAGFAYGVPQLLLPLGADQVPNARVAEREGLARVLMPDNVTADEISRSVMALLDEPGHRAKAQLLAGEIEQMPGPDAVAARLIAEVGAG